eukprot:5672766-Pleurochrysis_carterae.AAC.2
MQVAPPDRAARRRSPKSPGYASARICGEERNGELDTPMQLKGCGPTKRSMRNGRERSAPRESA